jgi:hypothetical protein
MLVVRIQSPSKFLLLFCKAEAVSGRSAPCSQATHYVSRHCWLEACGREEVLNAKGGGSRVRDKGG